jgi:hypothetical protein
MRISIGLTFDSGLSEPTPAKPASAATDPVFERGPISAILAPPNSAAETSRLV